MTGMKRDATHAVIYLRVSTGKQAASGLGLEAQEAKCREHCARMGWEVLSVHRDEALSGRDDVQGRPGLLDALSAVEGAPGRVLVAYSLSRLSRSQRITWHLLDDRGGRGVPFSSASEAFDTSTPMGRAMLGMIGVWSQLEADATAERTRDALAAAKARGRRLGAPTMIESFEVLGQDERGKRLVRRYVDPAKVELVRRVQAMAASGMSPREVADALNGEGTASVNGKLWHRTSVRKALAIDLEGK